jgi:predicted ATPase
MAGSPQTASPLLGRLEEQRLVTTLLDDVATRGRALVLHGAPGIGKSRLLAEAERAARERGMLVLVTAGVQSETHLPFAGLHQLIRPVRAHASELRDVQRAALDAAFGLTDEAGR